MIDPDELTPEQAENRAAMERTQDILLDSARAILANDFSRMRWEDAHRALRDAHQHIQAAAELVRILG